MASFPSTAMPDPSQAAWLQNTHTHKQGAYLISTRKLPILKAGPIDAMTARLGIPIPEMIFGDNLVSISHQPTGWSIAFTAEAALDRVDKTGKSMLRVAYAGEWSSSREKTSAGISEVVKPFDWSYTTDYTGTETAGATGEALKGAEVDIPLELLKRRDPILFHDEVVLYESELDDNGISIVTVKVRVMAQRMLLLCRAFMRLDNVLVRIRDTRVYVDFEKDEVIREYIARESKFADVKMRLMRSGLHPDHITAVMRDAQQVAEHVDIVQRGTESLSFAKS
ncbi:TIP41-like family-domain-containing protein [Cercophora newfieldiana]|uniref:TIP41-like family-domain-containing protein n=1 Tax=Cercophora newfieldiana TaxID=92897 RepID=A0AA39Y4G4_9PEZI|nr:TIP41-like family-domain-containing protein [Cercophora newfieldiana]